MVLSEYQLIHLTSVVTVSVGGIFREIFTIVIAHMYMGDRSGNYWGLALALIGIILFNWYKIRKMKIKAMQRRYLPHQTDENNQN